MTCKHEWTHNGFDFEDGANCKHCKAWLDTDEIERRLNENEKLREFYKLIFRYWMIPNDTPTDKRIYEAIADLDHIVFPSKEEQIKIVSDILKEESNDSTG